MESLLQLTPWKWRHLNTSVKVDSPVSVDVSLTSHYRLTGKHFITKYLREYLKMFRSFTKFDCIYLNRIFRQIKHTLIKNKDLQEKLWCDSFWKKYNSSRVAFLLLLELQKQRDCASVLKRIPNAKGRDGVYTIYPDLKTKKLVYCDMTTEGGGWTVSSLFLDFRNSIFSSQYDYKK